MNDILLDTMELESLLEEKQYKKVLVENYKVFISTLKSKVIYENSFVKNYHNPRNESICPYIAYLIVKEYVIKGEPVSAIKENFEIDHLSESEISPEHVSVYVEQLLFSEDILDIKDRTTELLMRFFDFLNNLPDIEHPKDISSSNHFSECIRMKMNIISLINDFRDTENNTEEKKTSDSILKRRALFSPKKSLPPTTSPTESVKSDDSSRRRHPLLRARNNISLFNRRRLHDEEVSPPYSPTEYQPEQVASYMPELRERLKQRQQQNRQQETEQQLRVSIT